jgi:2'-5' RNA ligase
MSPTLESTQGVITELIQSETHSPAFSPHITLLHPIPKSTPVDEIKSLLKECIKQADLGDKLSLSLNPAQGGSHYYQSVLAPVSPDNQLSKLREVCEKGFKWKGDSVYFPHLSLLYGDITTERRDELAKKVNEEMALPNCVEIKEIAVVDCTGTAGEWRTVATVSLA